jgi:hypothetical protein
MHAYIHVFVQSLCCTQNEYKFYNVICVCVCVCFSFKYKYIKTYINYFQIFSFGSRKIASQKTGDTEVQNRELLSRYLTLGK